MVVAHSLKSSLCCKTSSPKGALLPEGQDREVLRVPKGAWPAAAEASSACAPPRRLRRHAPTYRTALTLAGPLLPIGALEVYEEVLDLGGLLQ